ncbi:MAG TPA: hypothetical protein VMT89_10030, partial [Candidatus Acidoferrales bacterium]|nr:hypothetical protein [Candidatus Acidoferrales bacterium]
GWANIAAGLKYTLFRDVDLRALATIGLRYEVPTGDQKVFQGPVFSLKTPINLSKQGAGVLNPFLSGGYGVGDLHALLYMGGRVAMDSLDSSFFDLSLHVDYQIAQFYPLIELNWVQVVHGGSRLAPVEQAFGAKMNQEGFDFFNLGAPSAEGGVVTMAFGGRWRILTDLDLFGRKGGLDLGAAYEIPVTDRADLFGWRVTTDLILWAL